MTGTTGNTVDGLNISRRTSADGKWFAVITKVLIKTKIIWVLDTENYDEGWFYWASPLPPGQATSLFVTELTINEQSEDWEYVITPTADFVTRGTMGDLQNFSDEARELLQPTEDGAIIAPEELVDSGIDYAEILDEINNPERGFYTPHRITMRPQGSDIMSSGQVSRARHLIHLRVDIRAFGMEAEPDERVFP